MTEQSLARTPRTRTDLEHVGSIAPRVLRGSTRHLTTDARFAAILAEDFGIPSAEILRALEGEPRRQAIEICAWAEKTREPEKALSNWARKLFGRELFAVPEDHEVFFGGDELCRPCGRRHDVL